MAVSIEHFGKTLTASGLMTADEVKAVWSALPADGRPADGDAFAKLLIAEQKLTEFQARQLLTARGMRLVLGDYVVLQEIGAGGMGRVYKAMHRRMHRIVALKVMSAAAMKDEASVKRFQREVRAAARLEHPNIVTAYASGDEGNVKYLVMQFVDGGDLSSFVKKHGPLPIEQAVDFVRQAATGLAYAHGEGVIHRDIKPANLLLDKKGVVKILDMGLARIESSDDGLTATEQVMGTVDYMSPEQAANTKSADARADVYSLGCTLWYLLTAKKLYEVESMIGRLMAHRDAPLPSLVKTRDDAPWPLEQALHKMIAKRPEERLQSMNEVVDALAPFGSSGDGSSSGIGSTGDLSATVQSAEMASFLQGAPLSAPSQTKVASSTDAKLPKVPPRQLAGGRLNQGRAAVAGGGLLVATLAVWYFLSGNDQPAPPVAATSTAVIADTARPRPAPPGPSSVTAPAVPGAPIAEKLESTKYVWTIPENLGRKINDGTNNRGATLSADQLCLVVATDQSGVSDLVEYRRPSVNEPWGSAVFATGSDAEHNPCLSADGLQLLFASNSWKGPDYVGGWDLWIRRRSNRDSPWDAPRNLGPDVNSGADEGAPALSPNGLSLAFHSTRPDGQGGNDLWISRRESPTAPFGAPLNLGQTINSYRSESHPHFIGDDDMLLFERDGELFVTFRNASGAVGAIALPNQPCRFQEPWLSPDGASLYFNNDQLAGCGGFDVWLTRRVLRDSPEAKLVPPPLEELRPPEIDSVPFAGHSYQWVRESRTWFEANLLAQSMGGHLASVASPAEDEWLKTELLADLPTERMVWIGGIKENGNEWHWSTGEPLDFAAWPAGEGTDGTPAATGIVRRESGPAWADWGANSRAIAQTGAISGQSRCVGFVVEWDSPTPAKP